MEADAHAPQARMQPHGTGRNTLLGLGRREFVVVARFLDVESFLQLLRVPNRRIRHLLRKFELPACWDWRSVDVGQARLRGDASLLAGKLRHVIVRSSDDLSTLVDAWTVQTPPGGPGSTAVAAAASSMAAESAKPRASQLQQLPNGQFHARPKRAIPQLPDRPGAAAKLVAGSRRPTLVLPARLDLRCESRCAFLRDVDVAGPKHLSIGRSGGNRRLAPIMQTLESLECAASHLALWRFVKLQNLSLVQDSQVPHTAFFGLTGLQALAMAELRTTRHAYIRGVMPAGAMPASPSRASPRPASSERLVQPLVALHTAVGTGAFAGLRCLRIRACEVVLKVADAPGRDLLIDILAGCPKLEELDINTALRPTDDNREVRKVSSTSRHVSGWLNLLAARASFTAHRGRADVARAEAAAKAAKLGVSNDSITGGVPLRRLLLALPWEPDMALGSEIASLGPYLEELSIAYLKHRPVVGEAFLGQLASLSGLKRLRVQGMRCASPVDLGRMHSLELLAVCKPLQLFAFEASWGPWPEPGGGEPWPFEDRTRRWWRLFRDMRGLPKAARGMGTTVLADAAGVGASACANPRRPGSGVSPAMQGVGSAAACLNPAMPMAAASGAGADASSTGAELAASAADVHAGWMMTGARKGNVVLPWCRLRREDENLRDLASELMLPPSTRKYVESRSVWAPAFAPARAPESSQRPAPVGGVTQAARIAAAAWGARIACPHGCGALVEADSVADHEEVCPERLRPCLMASAGCPACVRRAEMPVHLDWCPFAAVEPVGLGSRASRGGFGGTVLAVPRATAGKFRAETCARNVSLQRTETAREYRAACAAAPRISYDRSPVALPGLAAADLPEALLAGLRGAESCLC